MTRLQILKLALKGAEEKIGNAARYYEMTKARDDKAIESIRSAIAEYDGIKGLIEKCEKEQ